MITEILVVQNQVPLKGPVYKIIKAQKLVAEMVNRVLYGSEIKGKEAQQDIEDTKSSSFPSHLKYNEVETLK